jgi:SAM-dependent methyltransferase
MAHHQRLDFFLRLAYREQLRRFRKAGLTREHRLLDYGCGGGQLVTYLRDKGYARAAGYDPYADPDGFGDVSVLERAPFDYICLQEVIEHVEEPRPLLAKLSGLLREGGVLLVGMPSGDDIDLSQVNTYKHHLHVPYHLHIYTRATLDRLAADVGLYPIASYRRFFTDSPFFGMNEAFFRSYVEHIDGTVDALSEPIRVGKILASPTLLFHGSFGYFYSGGKSITAVFKKRSPVPGMS